MSRWFLKLLIQALGGLLSISIMTLAATPVFAQVVAQEFKWRADGAFTLSTVQNGTPLVFKGSLRDGEKSEGNKAGAFSAEVRSFPPSFISVVITQDGRDAGQIFVFERVNANFDLLTPQPITGRSAVLSHDLYDALNSLKKVNGWDAALSFRAMVAFFNANPTKDISAFANDSEVGRIKTVARPAKFAPRSGPAAAAGGGGGAVTSRPLPPPPGFSTLPLPPPAPQMDPRGGAVPGDGSGDGGGVAAGPGDEIVIPLAPAMPPSAPPSPRPAVRRRAVPPPAPEVYPPQPLNGDMVDSGDDFYRANRRNSRPMEIMPSRPRPPREIPPPQMRAPMRPGEDDHYPSYGSQGPQGGGYNQPRRPPSIFQIF